MPGPGLKTAPFATTYNYTWVLQSHTCHYAQDSLAFRDLQLDPRYPFLFIYNKISCTFEFAREYIGWWRNFHLLYRQQIARLVFLATSYAH